MAAPRPTGNQDLFDTYFRRADLDGDGRISGAEAVAFFQRSGLHKNVLAQVWSHADEKKAGYLGREEFYNALKLVTVAQSRRELTPAIVEAAIRGPASANIPAPNINLAAAPSPQPRGIVPATQAQGGPQMGGTVRTSNQQVVPGQQNQFTGPPQSQPQQNFQSQGMPAGGTSAPRTANQPMTSDCLSGRSVWPSGQVNSQIPSSQSGYGLTAPNSVASNMPKPHMTPAVISSTTARPQESAPVHKLHDSSAPGTRALDAPSNQLAAKDPKELAAAGNGFPSDSLFGDVFSVTSAQPRQHTAGTTSTVGSSSASGTPGSTPQPQPRPQHHPQPQHQPRPQHQPHAQPQPYAQPQHSPHSLPQHQPHLQSQAPWPKMTPADVQKYSKVFVQVDTDRDGKITGHQARNLFLSWKLPREALKHVWELSDQDNDSMLSLREFCIAVYLMERYREGRPLPPVFPSTIISSESMFTSPSQSVAPQGNASWGHTHGQVHGSLRPPAIPKGKPPRPVPLSPGDGMVQSTQPKRKMPELEKHLVDQLSKEEQDSLNSKFEEATAIDKKVDDLEKEIADSKQKIEFFHAKMQELVLYKSRCDNRYNEITERVSGDKRELESLAKKYEEKYKKSGNVGSKLTIEEATFRDIQEKKMEWYQAIVKFEEGKLDDSIVKERTENIQSGLEELIKNLNERCKQYGVRGKPTTLVELPFGWQPGIQEGAADWDEDWDKLEEEGFTFVKELTLDVQNVIAPPKEKSSAWKKELTVSSNEGEHVSYSDVESKTEKNPSSGEEAHSDSKTDRNGSLDDSNARKDVVADCSPRTKDTRSENGHDDGESTASAGKAVNEPSYDSHDETDSVSSFNPDNGKDKKNDTDFGFGFGFDDFSIKPIKTGSTLSNDFLPPKLSLFSDSVPSPPAHANDGFTAKPSLFADSVPSTPATTTASYQGKSSYFDDSVPSTPAYPGNLFPDKKSFFDDSVPSTPAYPGNSFPEKKSFFDDSVPSTPAYSTSDFGGKPFASETPRSDNLFPGRSPFMFDSVPSTPAAHDDFSSNSFSRFDSFNNNDAFSLSRSDSMRSTSEPDPFASRFDSFNYQRYDSFNAQSYDNNNNNASETPKASLTRFDSIGSTRDSDYSHGFGFDDHDPFGSTGPFKTSTSTAETPRSSDHWNA
ncbi:unnamed protein product [Eruca vesicaria subsp. sativa]|uniref:Uncharacterized protein n=1 Tax=Eruca vesicaria subsp. sativa TaxID=29727 RepID=A0ABC8KGH3_ERUVS|nr:unnamed protein product [Eruca vesicaria subsp. sativa]